ncbi:MAG: acyltransferase [Pedobacter sp.]|nr:MAG: acyltransferase [Pedobacter sp.]
MQRICIWCYKVLRRLIMFPILGINKLATMFLLYVNNVKHFNFSSHGIPYISVAYGGFFSIGKNFKIINTLSSNPIGRSQKCSFVVNKGAKLIIGENVGISQAAIVCHLEISIGNDVKIGGGVCIYDTDFHSLDPIIRQGALDIENKVNTPVLIKANAFIGANSTILKGVTIGENSVIGACSLVAKNVPDNEIWAGNPAKFIRKINENVN